MAGLSELAKVSGITEVTIREAFEAVTQLVKSGEDVRISGFGTFSKSHKAARLHVPNALKPGTFYDTEAKDVLTFKMSKSLNMVVAPAAKARRR